MISPAFINSLFCYEDCFPHFRCHRYFWKKNNMSRSNDSWTALLESTLIYPLELQVCWRKKSLFSKQSTCVFLFFNFNGFWRENDATGGVINSKFWESMTTQKQNSNVIFFFKSSIAFGDIELWNVLMFLKVLAKWRVIKKSKLYNSLTNKSFHILCYRVVLWTKYLFDAS